ncbi:hypothetical protein FRC07_013259 [Ceratobasidium sp. 392]|nr:hypothetical protein FRC07_013259 [Ceratobasidium sp. 392]
MPPRKRVQCACKCGGLVTTSMEADHLQKKHYSKVKLVPSIVRKRRSILRPTKPDSARSKSPTSSPPVQSLTRFDDSQEPAPGPSGAQIEAPDHTGLWERVFATRATVSDDEDISNRSEELFSDDFKSQSDSDDEAQPEDIPQAQLNPLTQGIPPGNLLRQDMLVRGVVDAPNLLSSSQIDDIGTFDFIVKHKLSVSTYHDMQDRAATQAYLPFDSFAHES